MKTFECLSRRIDEENNDSIAYAKLALENKDTNPWLAKIYHDLSDEEYRHMEILHGAVTRVIKDYREANGEPPSAMLAVYDYLHGQQIEKAETAKRYQAMFR